MATRMALPVAGCVGGESKDAWRVTEETGGGLQAGCWRAYLALPPASPWLRSQPSPEKARWFPPRHRRPTRARVFPSHLPKDRPLSPEALRA
jgi:hypothetical protein